MFLNLSITHYSFKHFVKYHIHIQITILIRFVAQQQMGAHTWPSVIDVTTHIQQRAHMRARMHFHKVSAHALIDIWSLPRYPISSRLSAKCPFQLRTKTSTSI